MPATTVHKCRFIHYNPSAINSLSFTPASSKMKYLAVVRENGDLEFWNPKGKGWYLEKSIPGSSDTLIETVLWTHQTTPVLDDDEDMQDPQMLSKEIKWLKNQPPRLFAASLEGRLLEYSIETMMLVQETESNGGAIWSMAVNPQQTQLAIGCEDGFIRMFNIANGALEYLKSLEKHDGRILSLDWDSQRNWIVAGSGNSSIRKYDVDTGRCVGRMTVDTIKGEETIVWDLKMLNNGTMVSGDSLGQVTFWDINSCTALKSIKSHGADVLCLSVRKDGAAIFSSGVDRKVIQYAMTDTKSQSSWVLAGEKRYHSHDVRAIEWIQERPFECLVTGGMDTLLIMSSPVSEFPEMKQYRMPFFPHRPRVHVAKEARWIACRFDTQVKVWRLGNMLPLHVGLDVLPDQSRLPASQPKLLFTIQLDVCFADKLITKTSMNLHCSTISDNGQWLAVSNFDGIKLFHLNTDNDVYTVTKIKSFPTESLPPAYNLLFSSDSQRLIVAGYDTYIYILNLANHDQIEITQRLSLSGDAMEISDSQSTTSSLISHMTLSTDGQWLACAGHDRVLTIMHMDSLKIHCTLPQYDSPITSLTFHPTLSILVITLASNLFYLYDVDKGSYTDWTLTYVHKLPLRFTSRKEIVMGVSFDPASSNTMILWGANYFCSVDLQKPMGEQDLLISTKRKKKLTLADSNLDEASSSHFSQVFKMDHRYQPLMYLDFIGREMVVVERPALAVMKSLPQGYFKHQYGT